MSKFFAAVKESFDPLVCGQAGLVDCSLGCLPKNRKIQVMSRLNLVKEQDVRQAQLIDSDANTSILQNSRYGEGMSQSQTLISILKAAIAHREALLRESVRAK